MVWDPDTYLTFQTERTQPFKDLFQLIEPSSFLEVIDLGCGTGELTQRLSEALPGSTVLGIDSSPSMLERAKPRETDGLSFKLQRIEDVSGSWDLVFSHAALHWIPDHERLLKTLWDLLRPGGQLAIQMPSNQDHPAQQFVGEVAGDAPFAKALEGFIRHSPVRPVRDYADHLFRLGGSNLTAVEKIYPHVLENADAIVEWTRGTFLLPYMERLSEVDQEAFLQAYRDRVRERFPESPVFYGFKRVLLYARKP